MTETAVLAGGCFWCVEAVFDRVRGVVAVESGYTGGHVPEPSYDQVCSGATGHAEAVRVTYDPAEVSYRELLQIFFGTHDPTTPDRQGADVGTQYRSAIFYATAAQREVAEAVMAELSGSAAFEAPIVTELAPLGPFFPAEDYHRDYYTRNRSQPYCQFVISPKVAKLRKHFVGKLKPTAE